MAKVAVAVAADDFGPVAVCSPLHTVSDLVVKAGPAAAALELLGGLVERGVALTADVSACGFVVEERTSPRVFCASQ